MRLCGNIIQCTYTNLDSIAYYTPSLCIAYCSFATKPVQHVTELNTVGNYDTLVL